MYFFKYLALTALVFLLTACSNENKIELPDTVAQFDTADLNFYSTDTYSALTPWFNPFTQIELNLELTSPSGKTLNVPGFFDGNGNGGMQGRVFKVRVSPDEMGLWRWQLNSSLPELNHKKGFFNVTKKIPGIFGQGPVSISKKDPKRFAFANQAPLFLTGKFLDIDQPLFLQFSHTFLSEQWSDDQREQFLKHQKTLGVNKMNLYLANKGDYKNIATTPWLGSASRNIKSRFDLHWWHQYEKWIKRLRDEELIAHLWFFADDSGFNLLTDAERKLFIRYGMARLSAYANTIFTLALEWQEDFTEAEIRQAGILTQKNNPWDRLISVHSLSVTDNIDESTIFFNENWLDFIEIQTGFIDHPEINRLGQFYRQQNKPTILEEFSFGENNDEQRINTWAALLTMPAGIGTGSGIKAISNFLNTVDITKFDPANKLVLSDNAYAAAYNEQIIVYTYKGEPIQLASEKIRGKQGQWFNPRKGNFNASPFKLTTNQPLLPPSNQDWVLLITP